MKRIISKEILRQKISKATLDYKKIRCQAYYTKNVLESAPEFNPEFFETGIYGINAKEILQGQYNQLSNQKTYAEGYMQALKDLYEDFFDITEVETWMFDNDKKELEAFRQEQKDKTLNNYI